MSNAQKSVTVALDRPALIAMCERALLRVLHRSSRAAKRPLAFNCSARILAGKVHGLGDSVTVR